jgi:hypothetical protein
MKKSIQAVLFAFVLLLVLLNGCARAAATPSKPPTPLEIDALICQGCSTTASNGLITARFPCTVTAEEKAGGVTTVWAVDYSPDPAQGMSMTIALKKVNEKWELADKVRLQSCLDEKNAYFEAHIQTKEASTPTK